MNIKTLLIVINISIFLLSCSSVPEQPATCNINAASNSNALSKAKEALGKARRAKNSRQIKNFTVIARKQAQAAIKEAQSVLKKAQNLLKIKQAQTASVKKQAPIPKRQVPKVAPPPQAPQQQRPQLGQLQSRLVQWVTGSSGYLAVTLEDDLFETQQTELRPKATPHIKTLATFLNQHPQLWIRVEGHTDNRSSHQHNLGVSERRATSVKFALMQQGVSSKRIVVKGFGTTRTIANNSTEAGRRKNRRVEVVILKAPEPQIK